MKNKLTLGLLFLGVLLPASVLAFGDGYTDCERDAVYVRDFMAKPTISLRLRDRACMTDSNVMAVLSPTTEYRVVAETDGWYKVKNTDGSIGWAGSNLMTPTTENIGTNEQLGPEGYLSTKVSVPEPVISPVTVPSQASSLTAAQKLAILNKTKGYILLQVQKAGEAWYVNPVDNFRYYLKDGNVAYQMMRNFGLGIANKDLVALKAGDLNLINRLRGRIVLQVQENGEAYYVHPKDGSVNYLKDGAAAYQIMRNLSLGITDNDLGAITVKDTITNLYK